MKKLLGLFLVLSLIGNIVGLIVFDRALFYRDKITSDEKSFYNEGLRITSPEVIQTTNLPNLGILLGGSLFRYWFTPVDGKSHLVNYGGVEEKSKDTYAKLKMAAAELAPEFIVINAGFCEIHTAVHTGRDVNKAIESNMNYLRLMIQESQSHGIVPILTSLTPVRSAYRLAYSGLIDQSSEKKNLENRAIQTFNIKIAELARLENLPFIDLNKILEDETGRLRKEFSLTDGEHLNRAGYLKLSKFFVTQLEDIQKAEER